MPNAVPTMPANAVVVLEMSATQSLITHGLRASGLVKVSCMRMSFLPYIVVVIASFHSVDLSGDRT